MAEQRHGQKWTKTKELKNKLHTLRGKEVFLTDTQTSDFTKSSGEMDAAKIQYLQATVRGLERENQELKESMVCIKASGFYQINEDKLREVIVENERLRAELDTCCKDLEESVIERDFLSRFNRNLRIECESLTKEILHLRNTPRLLHDKKERISATVSSLEDLHKFQRSSSSEIILSRKRDKRKRQTQSNILNSDYFIGKSMSRSKPTKHGCF